MREEAKEWIGMAEDNLSTAKLLYENEKFMDTAFYCQQVAEKSLKALQIDKLERFDRTHDIAKLASTVSAPKKLVEKWANLTEYYIDARYPRTKPVEEADAGELLEKCEEVLEWVRSNLR